MIMMTMMKHIKFVSFRSPDPSCSNTTIYDVLKSPGIESQWQTKCQKYISWIYQEKSSTSPLHAQHAFTCALFKDLLPIPTFGYRSQSRHPAWLQCLPSPHPNAVVVARSIAFDWPMPVMFYLSNSWIFKTFCRCQVHATECHIYH